MKGNNDEDDQRRYRSTLWSAALGIIFSNPFECLHARRGGSRRIQDSVDKFSFLAKFDSVKFC